MGRRGPHDRDLDPLTPSYRVSPRGVTAGHPAVAWIGDRRRTRRKNADDVGFMPWTGLFFVGLLVALVLIGLAARMWLAA